MPKRIVISIMCAICSVLLWGQVTLNKAIMLPMNGDKVDRQRVEAIDAGVRGREAVWDMSHAIVVEDGCAMRFFNSGDSVVACVKGKQQFVYEIKGDSVLLRSQETAGCYWSRFNAYSTRPDVALILGFRYGDMGWLKVSTFGRHFGSTVRAVHVEQ